MVFRLFPQIPREKTARLLFSLEMAALWGGLAALIAVNMLSIQNGRPAYWNNLMMLLETPFSVPRHVDLASLLWKQGQKAEAKRLMTSAQTLADQSQPAQVDQSSNILGATTNPQAILDQWEHEAQELKEKYAFWQRVADTHPDYRDAFVTLTILAYQLEKLDDARAWLTRARALDPTSPTIHEIGKFLNE